VLWCFSGIRKSEFNWISASVVPSPGLLSQLIGIQFFIENHPSDHHILPGQIFAFPRHDFTSRCDSLAYRRPGRIGAATLRPGQPGIIIPAIHSPNILQDGPGKPGIFISTS